MIKLTPKQEKFCQVYIETGNASAAYRSAYNAENMKDSVIYVKASELLGSGKISVRIDELNGLHQKRHNITVDTLTAKYMAIYQMNLHENPNVAKSALDSLAKLHGLSEEKVRHVGNIQHNHQHESVSDTAQFIRDALGSGQQAKASQSLPH